MGLSSREERCLSPCRLHCQHYTWGTAAFCWLRQCEKPSGKVICYYAEEEEEEKEEEEEEEEEDAIPREAVLAAELCTLAFTG